MDVLNSPERFLAYAQLLLGFGAVVLAIEGGWFIVHQLMLTQEGVELAQQSITLATRTLEHTQSAHAQEVAAEERQTLEPLLKELLTNWMAAMCAEGRVKSNTAVDADFNDRVQKDLLAGRIWRLEPDKVLQHLLEDTYDKIKSLKVLWPYYAAGTVLVSGVAAVLGRGYDRKTRFITAAALIGTAAALDSAIDPALGWLRAKHAHGYRGGNRSCPFSTSWLRL